MSLKVRLAVRASMQVLVPMALLSVAGGAGCAGQANSAPAAASDVEVAPASEQVGIESAKSESMAPATPPPQNAEPEAATSTNVAPAGAAGSSTAAGSSNSLRVAGSSETRSVEVPATSAEAPKRPGLTVPETRTTQVIQATVAQNRLSVRACYEKALAVDAKLRGTLTVHFTIDEAGVVTSAEVNTQRTTLSEPGVQQCALAAVKKITFPKSSRGFESTVNYPFDFRPRY